MTRTTSLVGLFILVLRLTSAAVPATTWYVDGSVPGSGDGKTAETAFKYIQEAIDTSTNGDTVTVKPGIYLENIHFDGKNITLTSTNPYDWQVVEKTIIDGNQNGSVVTFDGTEDESCTLRGFTVRGGKADYGGGISGGEWGSNKTAATINNNIIVNNESEWSGGGILFCDGLIFANLLKDNSALVSGGGLAYCDGIIEGNVILRNSCTATIERSHGGGLHRCNGTIQNNVIAENNIGPRGGDGGGLFYCMGLIEGNEIYGNKAISGGALSNCGGTIQNNLIHNNEARRWGGALLSCDGLIVNNTITGNILEGNGGALDSCKGIIQNCIFFGNKEPQVYDSSTPIYSCIQDWTGGGEGNTSENPRFVDAENGNFRVLPDSPCIDAGKNEEWMQNATDFEGKPRILFGKSGLRADMGAHEYFYFGIIGIEKNPYNTQITWTSLPQKTFLVWSLENITNGGWKKEADVNAGGVLSSWIDNSASGKNKFYRIEKQELSE